MEKWACVLFRYARRAIMLLISNSGGYFFLLLVGCQYCEGGDGGSMMGNKKLM